MKYLWVVDIAGRHDITVMGPVTRYELVEKTKDGYRVKFRDGGTRIVHRRAGRCMFTDESAFKAFMTRQVETARDNARRLLERAEALLAMPAPHCRVWERSTAPGSRGRVVNPDGTIAKPDQTGYFPDLV